MATLNAEGTQSVEGFIAQVKQVATLAEEEKLARQQRNCSTREADEADELLQAIASRRGTSQGTAAGSGLGGGAEAGAAGAGGGEGAGEKIVVVVSMGEKGSKHEFRMSMTDKMSKVYAAMRERAGSDRSSSRAR